MTKREAVKQFNERWPRSHFVHIDGRLDKPMRRQFWNDYVDFLQKNGNITVKQAETWDSPFDQE